MKRRNVYFSLLAGIFLLSFFSITQFAAAASRENLLSEFCVSNLQPEGGFVDTPNGTTDGVTEFTTFANLYILHLIDDEFDMLLEDDLLQVQSWLHDASGKIEEDRLNIPAGYYAYYAANFTINDEDYNATIVENGQSNVLSYQNDTNYGFASNQSYSTNLIDTYFAIKFLVHTDGLGLINEDNVVDFVRSCQNSNSSLFSATPEGVQSLIDTYYGVATLNLLNETLETAEKEAIADYVDLYYWDDETDKDNFGGYSSSQVLMDTSILTTYYAVKTLELVEGELHGETLDWILARQNAVDYGFQDVLTTKVGGASSAKLSYYAVEIILSYEPNAFARNGVMSENIWDLNTSGWIVALIVLLCLAAIAGIGFGVYKYKNRL